MERCAIIAQRLKFMKNLERVKKLLENDGIKFLETKVFKDGVEKKAIAAGEGTCKLTIYEDTFINSDTDEKIMDFICSSLKTVPEKSVVENWFSWDYAKEHVRLVLRPRSIIDDGKFIKHQINDNLEFTFRIFIENGTIQLTCPYLKEWNIEEEELYHIALTNTVNDTVLVSMAAVLCMEEDEFSELDFPMSIITNSEKRYGASSILNTEELEKIAKKYDDDLYVIPSSLHECMISLAGKNSYESLKRIIKEGNKTQILPKDFLADYPFYYKKGSLKIDFEQKSE